MRNKAIKDFEYLFLKNDNFSHKKNSRKRNDIIIIEFNDGSRISRLYLNNTDEYIDIPNNSVMLNEISHITWTKDSNCEHGVFVKSHADDKNLKSILKRYNLDSKYKLHAIKDEEISQEEKKLKRKEFTRRNPYANTENPDREAV